jgi:hypothetical protein
MARKRANSLIFPMKGLNKRYGFQAQPPYTTPNALNVRPDGTLEGRARGGSRPGLGRRFAENISGQVGTDGASTQASSWLVFTSAGATFSTQGVTTADSLVITQGGTNGNASTYAIAIVDSETQLTLSSACGDTGDASGMTYYIQFATRRPIRMLAAMRSVDDAGLAVYRDSFDGADAVSVTDPPWNFEAFTSTWGTASAAPVSDGSGSARTVANNTNDLDAVILDSDLHCQYIDENASYSIGVRANIDSQTYRHIFLFGKIPAAPTDMDSSVVAYMYAATGFVNRYTFTLYVNNAPVASFPTADVTTTQDGWFEMVFTPDNWVHVFYSPAGGLPLLSLDLSGYDFGGNKAVGFGLQAQTTSGTTYSKIDEFVLTYTSTATTTPPPLSVVASANGEIWAEQSAGVMSKCTPTAAVTLNPDEQLMAVDRLGKLYIADWGVKVEGADGAADDPWTTFVSVGSNFTTSGVIAANDLLVIDGGHDNITPGTYTITAVSPGADTTKLTLSAACGHTGAATTVEFRVERAPKVYDPAAQGGDGDLAVWTATAGTVPTGCKIIGVYQDRVCLMGDPEAPGAWYMSRRGFPLDFNTGASDLDVARAIAGISTDSDAGGLALPITAFAPFSDDLAILGATSELWRLVGDPTLGGRLNNVSYKIGIVDRQAWCHDASGNLWFLSYDGIYMLPRGSNTDPISLSREVMPGEMRGSINTETSSISLAYDLHFRGIHIFLTPKTAGGGTHWWYDLATQGFWKAQFQNDHEPLVAAYRDAILPNEAGLMLGGRDGFIRYFGNNFEDDDGSAISNFMDIGPIRLGNDVEVGMLMELRATLATSSGDVTWALFVAETAEAVTAAAVFDTGTWSADLNYSNRPQARGAAYILRVTGSGTAAWAMENVLAITELAGPVRKV